jgi:hypothetical protein
MENNNNISEQLSNIIDTDTSSFASDSSSSGFFDWIKNIGITTWIIIILIFSFLGFNIFTFLGKGTDQANTILQPLINVFRSIFGGTTSQIVDVSAEGGKAVTNTAAGVVTDTLNAAQKVANQPSNETDSDINNITSAKNLDSSQINTLNKALNSTAPLTTKTGEYQEDDSASSIQRGTSKGGWCYIGEDRGFRTCAQVGPNDECMSGDIFPSNEICMNPSLRA